MQDGPKTPEEVRRLVGEKKEISSSGSCLGFSQFTTEEFRKHVITLVSSDVKLQTAGV